MTIVIEVINEGGDETGTQRLCSDPPPRTPEDHDVVNQCAQCHLAFSGYCVAAGEEAGI